MRNGWFLVWALLPVTAAATNALETRHPECLEVAYDIEDLVHAGGRPYLTREDEIRNLMPDNCKAVRFSASARGKDGYSIIMDVGREVWLIDDLNKFTRLKGTSLETAEKPAGFGGAIGRRAAPDAKPGSKPTGNADAAADKLLARFPKRPDMAPPERLKVCFDKAESGSDDCAQFFTDSEAKCGAANGKPTPFCADFNKAVDTVALERCTDISYGPCELRVKHMKNKCNKSISTTFSSDCKMLSTFMATYVPPENETRKPSGDKSFGKRPVASCARGDREVCAVEYCKAAMAGGATEDQRMLCLEAEGVTSARDSVQYMENAKTLTSSLSMVDRLRPVLFDWKLSHLQDIGFMAEEMASREPILVIYSEQGDFQSVKYPAITALLTGAVQELHLKCSAFGDQETALSNKLKELEGVNFKLIHELKSLTDRLEQMKKDLDRLNAKAGLK
jgi:hypothetical protein